MPGSSDDHTRSATAALHWVGDDNVALLTDLYELTMAAAYVANGLDAPATFDLFVRSLPAERAFLVTCGLEQALDYLEGLHFPPATLDYLDSLGLFERRLLDRLATLRFTGEVWAMPEGESALRASRSYVSPGRSSRSSSSRRFS